jgi:hypothetical protein
MKRVLEMIKAIGLLLMYGTIFFSVAMAFLYSITCHIKGV